MQKFAILKRKLIAVFLLQKISGKNGKMVQLLQIKTKNSQGVKMNWRNPNQNGFFGQNKTENTFSLKERVELNCAEKD